MKPPDFSMKPLRGRETEPTRFTLQMTSTTYHETTRFFIEAPRVRGTEPTIFHFQITSTSYHETTRFFNEALRVTGTESTKFTLQMTSTTYHETAWSANVDYQNWTELNQPDGEEEVVRDGKRLEQKYRNGGRFRVVTDNKNWQKVADEAKQTDHPGADGVNGERQRCRAVSLSHERRRRRGIACRVVGQFHVVRVRVQAIGWR